jgi:uncharacterized protein (TIGR02118 family)
MIKLVCFLRRREDLSVEDFHRHWREVHGPLVANNPATRRYVVRYEQNHRAMKDYERPGGPDFDGVAIQWFESFRDFIAAITAPEWAEITVDEGNFLDREAITFVMTEAEEVVFTRT